ncbi:PREDICTED: putative nuclease HARBI1 [Gekko japonicus]|uniref:Nuclease HARBI1 n=1 Tax=Gekko japonicus TaxID=146911 RepID=A0ABM1JPN1_GEKJA|nr:PREDICTED: putative nuclease HARBI1 [Gekko japonicus]
MVSITILLQMILEVLHMMISSTEALIEVLTQYLHLSRRRRERRRRTDLQALSHAPSRYNRRASIRAWAPVIAAHTVPRRWWVKDRSEDWWDNTVMATWIDEDWLKNFRMSRATFFELAGTLRHRLERQNTRIRPSIPVEKRLAITLWYLANQEYFRNLRHQFGVGLSTAFIIMKEGCRAILEELFKKKVCLPNEVGSIMDGFARMGFPNCIGALDGSHIPVAPPAQRAHIYKNRKGGHSILLQGAVDHRGRFIDAEIGKSGRNHDSSVFRSSKLCRAMDGGVFVPGNPTITVNGVTIPPLMLADGGYPIRGWLMTPFRSPTAHMEKVFNKRHAKARVVVERAFGRLKSRWSCLTKRLRVKEEDFTPITAACVVLHNICEEKGHLAESLGAGDIPLLPVPPPDVLSDRRHKTRGERVRAALMTVVCNEE